MLQEIKPNKLVKIATWYEIIVNGERYCISKSFDQWQIKKYGDRDFAMYFRLLKDAEQWCLEHITK